jgi:hypothetical protein
MADLAEAAPGPGRAGCSRSHASTSHLADAPSQLRHAGRRGRERLRLGPRAHGPAKSCQEGRKARKPAPPNRNQTRPAKSLADDPASRRLGRSPAARRGSHGRPGRRRRPRHVTTFGSCQLPPRTWWIVAYRSLADGAIGHANSRDPGARIARQEPRNGSRTTPRPGTSIARSAVSSGEGRERYWITLPGQVCGPRRTRGGPPRGARRPSRTAPKGPTGPAIS